MTKVKGRLYSHIWQLQLCIHLLWMFTLSLNAIAQTIREANDAHREALVWQDLNSQFIPWLKEQGVNAENFFVYLQKIQAETALRQQRGEWEHLIFYALQSTKFTAAAKVEPAISAQRFAEALEVRERKMWVSETGDQERFIARIPQDVSARLNDLQKALRLPFAWQDERLRVLAAFLQREAVSAAALPLALRRAYIRAMRFLHQKEFEAKSAGEVAALYQTRGHSTDTQIEANFAVHTALAMVKSAQPGWQVQRVLIVGPGLDFAPRTDLLDAFGPQSYQPFAVADALTGLKIGRAGQFQLDCADINDRVLDYLRQARTVDRVRLSILSGLADRKTMPLTAEFKAYFAQLGQHLGTVLPLQAPATFTAHLAKRVEVDPIITKMIYPLRLNVIVERPVLSRYDLVIVTNVLSYFDDVQLLLAAHNLALLLAEGGYLVHNDPRLIAPAVTPALEIPVRHTRTVLLADHPKAPLYDFIAVHQKRSASQKQSSLR